jgi:hypothetical protein
MLLELGSGHGRTDTPAAVVFRHRSRLGDALDVDDQRRVDELAAHLHEQIRPAGEDARLAVRGRQERRRTLNRVRCLVSHQPWVLQRGLRRDRQCLSNER